MTFALGGIALPQGVVFVVSPAGSFPEGLALTLDQPPTVGTSDPAFAIGFAGRAGFRQVSTPEANVYFQLTGTRPCRSRRRSCWSAWGSPRSGSGIAGGSGPRPRLDGTGRTADPPAGRAHDRERIVSRREGPSAESAHDPDRTPGPPLVPTLLLFAASGAAALIHEVVWLQLLQLVLGSTAVSLGVLLATFMGGMGLGGLLLPRLVPARHHPLRVYAALELGIGALGLGVLFGMPYVDRAYSLHAGHGLAGVLIRGAVAAAGLLPPTLLMSPR